MTRRGLEAKSTFLCVRSLIQKSDPRIKIITRAGHQRHATAIGNSGADEIIIPEHEGGLMTSRMIQKCYPVQMAIE